MTTDPALTLAEFWSTIATAWATIPDTSTPLDHISDPTASAAQRGQAATTLTNNETPFLAALRAILDTFDAPKLAAWDAHIERLLYDIDREEVHEYLEGSDDGFLYARGFVVAAGQRYYDLVNARPSDAAGDWEMERICYIAAHLHDDKFGSWPSETAISRETGSNSAWWGDE